MNAVNFKAVALEKTNHSPRLTDVTLLLYMNLIKDEIAAKVKKIDEDYFGTAYQSDLEAGVRNYGLPATLLEQFKKISAKLDGTNEQILTETDIINESGPYVETNIVAMMSGREPQFDIFGGELWILSDAPIITVSGGLKIYGMDYPDDIANLTNTDDLSIISLPRALHGIWLRQTVAEFKADNSIELTKMEDPVYLEALLNKSIDSLTDMNQGREFVPTFPIENGEDY